MIESTILKNNLTRSMENYMRLVPQSMEKAIMSKSSKEESIIFMKITI